MATTILTTVGTSLLTGRQRDRPWVPRNKGDPLPPESVVTEWLRTAELAAASAEINTLNLLGSLEDPTRFRVRLIHSDSEDGKFCALRLQEFLETRSLKSETRRVDLLRYDQGSTTFRRGLKNLVRTLFSEIDLARKTGSDVLIAATGGFKAEIAYTNVIAMLQGVSVFYVYEDLGELVELEPLPLQWKRESFRALVPILEELSARDVLPDSKIQSWRRTHPEIELLLEDMGGGEVALSALGTIIAEASRLPVEEWPAMSTREPSAKNGMDEAHQNKPEQTSHVVDKLTKNPYVEHVRYGSTPPPGLRAVQIEVVDATNGELGVRFGDSRKSIVLIVGTTARGSAQCELIRGNLERKLRRD
ncbi:MAG: putative CRISPR-associated protein [Deltaproteobacteria bacterium]|nr:putative CRISPR-associated protein [Deltaproteobacteria bacterium]